MMPILEHAVQMASPTKGIFRGVDSRGHNFINRFAMMFLALERASPPALRPPDHPWSSRTPTAGCPSRREPASRSGVSVGWEDASKPFQAPDPTCCIARRLPIVIRLVAIPDTLHLTDFDDLFHAAASAEFVGSEQWRYQAQAVGQFSDGLDAPSTTTI